MADEQTPAQAPMDLTQLGGPADVQATMDTLQQGAAQAQPPGALAYEKYKQQIQQNTPGIPDSEKERLALSYAQMDVNQQNSAAIAKQKAADAEAQRIDATNASRIRLGLPPLPGGTVASQQMGQAAGQEQQPTGFEEAPPQAPDSYDQMAKQQQGLLGEYQQNIGRQKQINQSMADLGTQKAKFEMGRYQELEKQAQQDEATAEIKRAERQNELQGYHEDLETAQKQYRDFLSSPDAKVNTNRLWENMGTGQKILAGISMALGALGAGNTGKNTAVEVIQNAISHDIDAQKNNIRLQAEGKLQNYNMSNNMYAQMLKKYQNEDMADAAVRLLRNQQVQMQLNQIAAGYSGAQVQQQAKLANAALDQSSLQLKQQFMQAANQMTLMKQAFGGQGGDLANMNPAAIAMLPKEQQEAIKDARERSIPGFGGMAPTKEAAEKLRVDLTGAKSFVENLQDAIHFAENSSKLGPGDRATMATKINLLIPNAKEAMHFNRLTDTDLHLIENTLGNPNSLTSIKSLEILKLKELLKRTQAGIMKDAKNNGLIYRPPVKPSSFKPEK